MIVFNKSYAALTLFLFLVEVFIALYVHDHIIRPYIGDVLVVILIYCFVKSFVKLTPLKVALGVLLFSYTIELSQLFNLCSLLRLEHNKWALIILGNTFGIEDLIAYTVGLLLTVSIEKIRENKLQ